MPSVRYACTVLALAAALSACGLTRGPQTLAERTARTAERLAAAPSPDARRAVAVALFAEAGLTPVAGLRAETGARFEVGSLAPGALVAGLVPGRRAGRRDTLVVLAAALGGPHAATLVEAARLLVTHADSRGDAPERSVLVALWPAGAARAEGLMAVRAFPLWPRGAVRVLLVAEDAPAILGEVAFGVPVETFQTGVGERVRPDQLASWVLASAGSVRPTSSTD